MLCCPDGERWCTQEVQLGPADCRSALVRAHDRNTPQRPPSFIYSVTAAGVNKSSMFSFSEVENWAVLIGG